MKRARNERHSGRRVRVPDKRRVAVGTGTL
jgi:hypothetical protein